YFEPENLVILNIFNNNIEDIKEILNNNGDSNICSFQKFINQCVDLYKSMHEKHCSNFGITNPSLMSTCVTVNSFKVHYEKYRSKEKITYELPELSSNTPKIIIDGCQSKESESVQASSIRNNQSDPSIIQNVPLGLGIMAGISSLLALIYKVKINYIKIYEKYLKHMIILPCSIK
ncbi:hypothetical protein PCYB_003830, partial [Plasmodium cynomolgi strain B]